MMNLSIATRAAGVLTVAGSFLLSANVAPADDGPAAPTQFLLAPAEARALGLDTVWQSQVRVGGAGTAAKVFVIPGDSVFVTDAGCHVARVLIENGSTVWANACGRATDRIFDVDRTRYAARLPEGRNGELTPTTELDEVLVTLDAGIISLDAHNGHLVQTQRLERVPSTRALLHGRFLIFGARGGQLVWQQYPIGHLWKCNELGGAILSAPIEVGPALAAASTTGDVLLVNPDTTRQIWRRTLPGAVQGSLAAGDGAVFAASADQAIHAFEASTGKTRWRHLTSKALTCNLFADDERVYGQIPGEGLVALATRPSGMLEPSVVWSARVPGDAICRAGNRLLVWDAATKKLTALDAASGHIEGSAHLADVVDLEVTGATDPNLYLLGTTGTLQRLVVPPTPAPIAE